jgi:hypothetical protein
VFIHDLPDAILRQVSRLGNARHLE